MPLTLSANSPDITREVAKFLLVGLSVASKFGLRSFVLFISPVGNNVAPSNLSHPVTFPTSVNPPPGTMLLTE